MLKYFTFISLCAGMSCAGDFMTGQAARAVIGQPFFTAQNSGTSATTFGGIGGLAYAANTLFATDANRLGLLPNNNRLLIFNNIGQTLPPPDADIGPYMGRCPMCGGQASVVLGQPDFVTAPPATLPAPSASNMRIPTAVASDGQTLAVADTSNNRVLIWRTIPALNGQPADIVLGQPDLVTVAPLTVSASTFRGPQGVWIQGGRLFVADTQNHRVLVWNSIPTTNNQAADDVLGEPNLATAPPITTGDVPPQANNPYSPVAVTSDGQRLFVTDLAHNRVLIWNSIPTATQVPADVEVGQPDMVSEVANNVYGACVANGTDSDGHPTYPSGCVSFCPYTGKDSTTGTQLFPAMCGRTLNFPRYALSDGQRL